MFFLIKTVCRAFLVIALFVIALHVPAVNKWALSNQYLQPFAKTFQPSDPDASNLSSLRKPAASVARIAVSTAKATAAAAKNAIKAEMGNDIVVHEVDLTTAEDSKQLAHELAKLGQKKSPRAKQPDKATP